MVYTILQTVEVLLWIFMAVSVFYVLFFAVASLLPLRKSSRKQDAAGSNTFLVLFPAYNEDSVIVQSVEAFLQQDYPHDKYRIVVISDHNEDSTNARLSKLPVTLLIPHFEKSSKAKAMQFAIEQQESLQSSNQPFVPTHVVILDADNIVGSDFLTLLDAECRQDFTAIQCHRTAKNSDNDIAALDGLSEEINNSIFRKGHNRICLSSALIGSGMCFSYEWFRENVRLLDSAVEDRELEALLLRQRIHIHYAEHIHVMDEKVCSHDNFQRQRLRWMTGQVQTLLLMLPYLPKAIVTGNIDYIDKTLQQALIPRSLLLLFTIAIALLATALSYVLSFVSPMKWWLLLAGLAIALLLAIPRSMLTTTIFSQICHFPSMAWQMAKNLTHIHTGNKEFLHTAHGKEGRI